MRVAVVALLLTLAACGDESGVASAPLTSAAPASEDASKPAPETGDETEGDSRYPDVLAATATQADDGTWRFDVTLSSPYDTLDRYADAWRVLDPDGAELGVRVLTHDHANEQPFTRSLLAVQILADITEVTIEGRDQLNGWGGATVTIDLAEG
jgi:hypothetical protein